MRQLFEEYGGPVIAAIVIVILIAIVYLLKTPISNAFVSMTNNFTDTIEDQQTATSETITANPNQNGTTTNP